MSRGSSLSHYLTPSSLSQRWFSRADSVQPAAQTLPKKTPPNVTVTVMAAPPDEIKKPTVAPPNPPVAPPIPSHKTGQSKQSLADFPPIQKLQQPPRPQPNHNGTSNGNKPPLPSKNAALPKEDFTPPLIKLNGHVGFDSLPHQVVKKAVEQGFQFNLMCVGETGMGKTTLIESLFNMKLDFPPCNNELNNVELRSRTYNVLEGGIHLKLTLVETAGFGDQLDKEKSMKIIVDYINERLEDYLREELRIRRHLDLHEDKRIHACLYFISPTGHGLKALDVVTLRALAARVNVIPVIAKADTTRREELGQFKNKILSELRGHGIPVYQFPTDDDQVKVTNKELNKFIPFAVIGSTDFVNRPGDGKLVRARKYPWGIVEVENEEHCDFVHLREALLRVNVDALRERTHKVLYENYRHERLRELKIGDGDTGPRLVEAFTQKQQDLNEDLARRESQIRDEFRQRLAHKEEEMRRREELLTVREREIEETAGKMLRELDLEMRSIMEDKARLEARLYKKARK